MDFQMGVNPFSFLKMYFTQETQIQLLQAHEYFIQ